MSKNCSLVVWGKPPTPWNWVPESFIILLYQGSQLRTQDRGKLLFLPPLNFPSLFSIWNFCPQIVTAEERLQFNSVQFSRSVVSYSLRSHEFQHARPPCPSPTPGVYSNPCPSSRWCHPAISSSVVPFSSCSQTLPASGSFPTSQPLRLTFHQFIYSEIHSEDIYVDDDSN